jgi:hypothetical protein
VPQERDEPTTVDRPERFIDDGEGLELVPPQSEPDPKPRKASVAAVRWDGAWTSDPDAARRDLAEWVDRYREMTGSRPAQLDVEVAVAEVAVEIAPSELPVTVQGQRVKGVRWRDSDGVLVRDLALVASAWEPPPDAYCVEDDCHEPVAGRRPLTQNIDELVCARHLRESADLGHPTTDSITGEKHTGSMIALIPSEADAKRIALDGGESSRQLHVTLWFLGEAAAMPDSLQAALRAEIADRAGDFEPIPARIFGASIWNPNGERGGSLNWNVGGPGDLEDIREEMATGIVAATSAGEADGDWDMAENHMPWAAHMCAMYAPTDDLVAALPAALERVGDVTLDRVRLTFGGEVIDIPLGAGQDADVPELAEEDITMGTDAAAMTPDRDAAAPKPPPGKRAKKAPNGQCPPGYRPDGDDCVSTSTPAKDSAADYPATPATECPPGQKMIDGECVPDESAAERTKPQPLPGEHFRATMHIQNVSTGRRTFKNLTWREPPFAFHRQKASSAHGGVPEVVQTGLVSRVVQDGDTLYGFGPIDLDSEEGLEHARRLVAGFERWVSIGLDEQPSNIEVVWPEADEDDDGNPLAALLQEPEQIIFDGGRIGELTSVSVPAQDEATVEPTAELIRLMQERTGAVEVDEDAVVTASVVGSTDLPVADRDAAWDGDGAMNRVWAAANDGQDTAAVARAFLYRDPDADPKTKAAWKLGFADVVGGTLKIIPGGVAATAGGRGVNSASIPDAEKSRIRSKICTLYGKVRAVHDDWPDCPFDSNSDSGNAAAVQSIREGYDFADMLQAFTAAAHRVEIPDVPPRWWYDEPTDVEITSALNITPEGRLYGALAPLNTGHRAFANSGRRLEVPFGNVDYDRFMGAWAVTSKGQIAAGPITMDCGHADRYRANHDVAPAHYDNACTVFGTVRVGENRDRGYVWVAGAVMPGVTPDMVARALACRLSGDWQPHPDKRGWQELVAALLVPSPGFPMAHAGPSLGVGEEIEQEGVLVASSVHAEVPVREAPPSPPTLKINPARHRVERVEAS